MNSVSLLEKVHQLEKLLGYHNFTGDADEHIYEALNVLKKLRRELGEEVEIEDD